MKTLQRPLLNYAATLFLIFFASIQFFLILRHKSPYLSDSFFYQHIYYQFRGFTFEEAYAKNLSQIDLDKVDSITRNFFADKNKYQTSLSFFIKRPLYPFAAYVFSFIFPSEYWNLLIPVFLGYLGVAILVIDLLRRKFNYLYTTLAGVLFISFYPYLDWSTYFLTDTIAAFFWFLQIKLAYNYISGNKNNTNLLIVYSLVLIISLLTREQSTLLVLLFLLLLVLLFVYRFPAKTKKRVTNLVFVSLIISLIYLSTIEILGLPSLYATIVYTQNSYGLNTEAYTLLETLQYLLSSIKIAHLAFFRDLIQHHWWLTITTFAGFAVLRMFFLRKKDLFDLLVVCSALASYVAIFLYPVLSYRFFYPLLFSLIFFATGFVRDYFQIVNPHSQVYR